MRHMCFVMSYVDLIVLKRIFFMLLATYEKFMYCSYLIYSFIFLYAAQCY